MEMMVALATVTKAVDTAPLERSRDVRYKGALRRFSLWGVSLPQVKFRSEPGARAATAGAGPGTGAAAQTQLIRADSAAALPLAAHRTVTVTGGSGPALGTQGRTVSDCRRGRDWAAPAASGRTGSAASSSLASAAPTPGHTAAVQRWRGRCAGSLRPRAQPVPLSEPGPQDRVMGVSDGPSHGPASLLHAGPHGGRSACGSCSCGRRWRQLLIILGARPRAAGGSPGVPHCTSVIVSCVA